jgi:luciferase family oxidoreductase group 1
VRAVPGAGLRVPIWLLGSSLFSAQLAAMLGLPFAFASHFAPDAMMPALDVYRTRFQPSRQLDRPYAMLGVNVFAAETDAEARRQFTSLQQAFVNLHRGMPGEVPPPVDHIEGLWSAGEQAGIDRALRYSFVGSADIVEQGLREFLNVTQTDELMLAGHFHDHGARLRSYEIAAGVRDRLAAA